jgi:spermidine synthase
LTTWGEPITEGFHNRFEGRLLRSEVSAYQKVDIYEHPFFGRVLTLDDLLQTSERDEFTYHEMLVHPALASRDRVERVLIIGGGDGGTLRHVLMHGVQEVVMCEIDDTVVRLCRELMPALSDGAFDDPRAKVVIGDGAAYVAEHEGVFDAVIVDGSDPVGPAVVLFSVEFYSACRRALRDDGVFISQTGSPMFQTDEFEMAYGNLSRAFGKAEPYLSFVPTYPGVFWSYMSATDGAPLTASEPDAIASRLKARGITTKLYAPDVHGASFALPPFVRDLCENANTAAVPRG